MFAGKKEIPMKDLANAVAQAIETSFLLARNSGNLDRSGYRKYIAAMLEKSRPQIEREHGVKILSWHVVATVQLLFLIRLLGCGKDHCRRTL